MKRNNNLFSEFSIKRELAKEAMRYKEELSEKKYKRVLPYIKSGIPKEYWNIDLDRFDGDPRAMRMVERYCNNIKEARKRGIGFLLTGPNGIGKTTLLMITLKEALDRGHSAFYMTLADIFHTLYLGFDCPELLVEFRNYVKTKDFVAIGDLGKDYHRKGSEEFVRAEFDVIFRHRRSRLLPTLMDTNMKKYELENTYGQSLMSLFASKTRIIRMGGVDYRKVGQKEDTNRLFGRAK